MQPLAVNSQPHPTNASPATRRTYDLATAAADYPDWEGPPQRTLLLCTHPRSGSTLLGEALHAAGGWGCPIEYFHRGFQPSLERLWGAPDFPAYLRAVFRHRTDPSGTLAVKLFWHDVEELCARLEPERHRWLVDSLAGDGAAESYQRVHELLASVFPNPTFIYLVREDALRQAVSGMIATQTGVWRAIPAVQENSPLRDPAYDFERIKSGLAFGAYCRRHWEGYFVANRLAPHRLTYEALAGRFAEVVRELFTALGRPEASVAVPRMRRQADARSEAMLLRFLREVNEARAPVPATTTPALVT